MNSQPKIFNIPAGLPFAQTLAQHVLDMAANTPEALSQIRILLPTRRACRVVQEAFQKINKGQAMILPRLQPIGDIDEEELALSSPHGDLALTLPRAISPLKRQILLARLIEKRPDFSQNFAQCLELANALGHFMDQIYNENLDLKNLANLVPDEFAEHWQITLEFLQILSETWPLILAEENAIDAADRRNRLILALNQVWLENPPQTPVIIAGTTGSIPATAALIKTVSTLSHGAVVLPGYDDALDAQSWDALEETHPQFGFAELLKKIDAKHEDIQPLTPITAPHAHAPHSREMLAREIMRPAQTLGHWMSLHTQKQDIENSLKNLTLIACEDEQQEADAIALKLRETLETPNKTACLITPDRKLAKRVKAAMQRWDIALDDSAGEPLTTAKPAQFLLNLADICEKALSPLSLITLLNHPYMTPFQSPALDLTLRGQKPNRGYAGLKTHIQNQDRIADSIKERALQDLEALHTPLTPLITLFDTPSRQPFGELLKTHLECAQNFIAIETLYDGHIGEKLSEFFADMLDHAHTMPPIDPRDYADILEHFMSRITIRPAYGTHPRLHILGQLEARLIDADCVILGGLNEGTWPAEPAADPWMSRPMRKDFGLPSPERSIGLSAHDFTQGLSAAEIILTRAMKKDGAPTVPARWLQRLDAVLQACDIDKSAIIDTQTPSWLSALHIVKSHNPIERPAPAPPKNARPKQLSVTKIETWLKDPYALYAEKILRLKKRDPFENPVEAALKGTILHEILETFTNAYPKALPTNTKETLLSIAKDTLASHHLDENAWTLWLKRFEKIAIWLENHETQWRETCTPLKTEAKGRWQIGSFTLTGIADRIDIDIHKNAALIDYKSGGAFSQKAMESGEYPQLPLEALMLQNGAFEGLNAMQTNSLHYWVLNGSGDGAKATQTKKPLTEMLEDVETHFKSLIEIFEDENTPYLSLPRPEKAPRYNDYLHLARVQEWSVLADPSESEAA